MVLNTRIIRRRQDSLTLYEFNSMSYKASAAYKKADGTISLRQKPSTVVWTPSTGSAPVSISVADITNLQKSPATSAKASVKIVVQPQGKPEPENFVLTFTSTSSAKDDQAKLVDLLKDIIASIKSGPAPASAADTTRGDGQPAAFAIANALGATINTNSSDERYADSRLITDTNLQRSLLNANPELQRRFQESYRGKPDSITTSQFSTQFWSTRLHLLRAHAAEKNQQHGVYNVLPEVKLKRVNDQMRLEITKEQIQLIFNQHPLVKRAYDDLVPQKFNEMQFWSNFVNSRLIKKLKGEKINESDSTVPELDRYMNFDEEAEKTRQFVLSHVPRFIDLEGNEQNHSQKKGNAPDISMRPQSHDKVPILKAINSLSKTMMSEVRAADGEAHAPAGMDESKFNELRLRDLQRLDDDNRIRLNVRTQQQFSSGVKNEKSAARKVDGSKVLQSILADTAGSRNLASVFDEDEESSTPATNSIIAGVKLRTSHPGDLEQDTGLSASVTESAKMTHNTSIEFLHYYWSVLLSGDAARAGELQKLDETLGKSVQRIEAVATQAEDEKQQEEAKQKKQAEEYLKKTNKRLRLTKIRGGKQAVQNLLTPTVRGLKFADQEYRRLYKEQAASMQG